MNTASRAIDLMGIEADHIILDLGCGDGYYSRLINQKTPRKLVDLDISHENLRNLKQQSLRNISDRVANGYLYVCGDALHLPFPEHSFDRVVCSLVFYLVPLQPSLDELYRVLKPGGRSYLRLPMLAWNRVIDAFCQIPDLRRFLYCTNQLLNGLFFALAGKQIYNPFLRNDHWACYIPLKRFKVAVCHTGFQMEDLKIDYPRPGIPSIEAWVRKP